MFQNWKLKFQFCLKIKNVEISHHYMVRPSPVKFMEKIYNRSPRDTLLSF